VLSGGDWCLPMHMNKSVIRAEAGVKTAAGSLGW